MSLVMPKASIKSISSKNSPSQKREASQKNWRRIFLREWRKYRQLTVEQLANDAGVSPGLISLIERRKSGGSPDSLEKLARALRCETGELLDIKPVNGGILFRAWINEQDRPQIEAIVKALSELHGK